MRVLLGVAMAAAAAGLASMAHLTATSTWLVLLPGFILAGIGLGITSTGLASAALSAVEPARAGMAAGMMNTLRQVGTATGVAVFGALYASRVTTATLHDLAGLPAPPDAVHRLAAAVASGAGTRVAALVPPAARAAVAHAARAGTASGLNDVLLAAAAFAALGAVVGFAYRTRPSQAAPASTRPRRTVRRFEPQPTRGWATGRARNHGPLTCPRRHHILDNITLYWLTGTGASAARSYWEGSRAGAAAGQVPAPVSLPVAFTTFPGEIFRAPRSWLEQAYPTLTYYHEADRGGHFAAWEEPQLFAEELAAAFRSLRGQS